MKYFFLVFSFVALSLSAGAATVAAESSHSDLNLVCRGANRGPIVRKLRQDIRAKLEAAGLTAKRISVALPLREARTRSTFTHDFSSDITVVADPLSVSFGGTLPSPDACTLNARLKIRVVLEDDSISSSTQDVSLAGLLLPARNFPKGQDGLGGAE